MCGIYTTVVFAKSHHLNLILEGQLVRKEEFFLKCHVWYLSFKITSNLHHIAVSF